MRLLIAGTPRSGNTWLRSLLVDLFELRPLALHAPDDVGWDSLPERCVLQLHWPPAPELLARLREFGFRTVVLARHPLDVLISILHFAPNEPQTARWLDGRCGDESSILNQTPLSPAVLQYACSPRFRALLDVGTAWWREPDVSRVRYELLVENPTSTLQALCGQLGEPRSAVDEAVNRNRLSRLRADSSNHHFWQGRPGLWRGVLPPPLARKIYAANMECFVALGYDLDVDCDLNPAAALANWAAIA